MFLLLELQKRLGEREAMVHQLQDQLTDLKTKSYRDSQATDANSANPPKETGRRESKRERLRIKEKTVFFTPSVRCVAN